MLDFPSMSENTSTSTASNKRRRDILNKFLTKTFHMLSQCPEDIAVWSHDGRSFTIKDVDAFENIVLPQYFNHRKFQSFVRQLNFYGFTKERSDPDLQTHTKAVRFSHPDFRRGEADLLHRITRTTAIRPTCLVSCTSGQMEQLQDDLTQLKGHVEMLEHTMDKRIEERVLAMEQVYMLRILKLEYAHAALLQKRFPISPFPPSVSSRPPSPAKNLTKRANGIISSKQQNNQSP